MKSIFKWFTLKEEITPKYLAWFIDQFGEQEFKGVDKMLYLYLEYCSVLGVPAISKYLPGFLSTEGKKLIKQYKIKLATMENYNYNEPGALEEASRIIFDTCMKTYEIYTEVDLSDSDFKVDMHTFIATRKQEALQQCMAEAFPKLANGGDSTEIAEDLQARIETIQVTYDLDCLEEIDFYTRQSSNKDSMQFLFKTGVPCIDGDLGGIYSKQLLAFTGPPGGGKTRFSLVKFAYQAMLAGIDVRYDELELSKGEVENILVAYHIVNLFGGKIKIPDKFMNQRLANGEMALPTEQRRYYEAAKIDLFDSGKYGKIDIRVNDLNVYGLRKRMLTYLRNRPNCKYWIIDYAGLAEYRSPDKYDGHKDEYEIIGDLYKVVKKVLRVADIGALILNQYTKEGNQANDQGKTIIPGHVQGGQIIERHADYDIAMTMTLEQKLSNLMQLSTIKVRSAVGFQNVPFRTDKSVSIFEQLNSSAVS